MDFFEAQYRAKRRTGLLVVLFAGAVMAIIAAVYLVVAFALGATAGPAPGFDPGLLAVVAVGTGAVVGLGSLFRTSQLRKGGPAVAALLGGRPVDPATTDPDERRLVNVVEEMALASGTPVPAIYVLPHEEGINAFAAGYTIHDAAVAVTGGALERLTREELEGVIAHEFSHILNGDMRLNIRLVGLLFGILLLAVVGRGLLRGGMYGRMSRAGRGRRGGGGQIAVLGLALVAVGYIGVLFGKVIKAAVSRQREYLADAAAVQFTRNPQGLAGALARIGGDARGSRVRDHHAEEMSHLFFAEGMGGALSNLFATHPPLGKRIHRLDPSWDGELRPEAVVRSEEGERREPPPGPTPVDMPLAAILLASVGTPRPGHVDEARRILDAVPPEVRAGVHDPLGARIVILGMLGGEDPTGAEARRDSLRALLQEVDAPPDPSKPEALLELARELPEELRLAVVDLALPALQRLDPAQARAFRREARRLTGSDGRLRPFEFALVHILWRHLPDAPPRGSRTGRKLPLGRLHGDLSTVLSALVRFGHADDTEIRRAFHDGARSIGLDGALELHPETALDLSSVDAALLRLERGTLEARRQVLGAMTVAVLSDEEVRPPEIELLRAVAEALELPLPPLLRTATG